MNNVFQYNSYRDYLSSVCSSDNAKRGFQSQLAKAAGCQAAYLSQVLRQRVHLTEDQLLQIAEVLDLSLTETNYMLLLLRYEKAATVKLKNYLLQELEKVKSEQNKISTQVNAAKIVNSEEILAKYFSSWIPSVVHTLTSSKAFRSIDKIADRLHIPKKETKEILNFLVDIGWVQKINQEFHYLGGSIHVEKDSPFQSAMQLGRRQMALSSIAINPQDAIHYSSVFTIDKEQYEELNSLILNFIKKSAKVIQGSGTNELCCICLDLFKVI